MGKMFLFGGFQRLALIQVFSQSCDLRPKANLKIGKEMPVFIGVQRLALIQEFGLSSDLRPMAD
jgi:hypothetical protein